MSVETAPLPLDPVKLIGSAPISLALATDVFDMIAPSGMLRRSSRTHTLLLLLGSALAGSAFSACSDPAYYDLCSDECGPGESGSAGDPSPGAGGSQTGGNSGNHSGGSAGATQPGNNSGSGGEGGDPEPAAGIGGARGGESGSNGEAGEGGSTDPTPECNPTLSPLDQPCLVSDAYAVFVRSDEAPGADGSEKNPLSSLAEAIERAESEGKIVIACGGIYKERLELVGLAARSRLRVFGGFQCANTTGEWSSGGAPTKIQPASGTALHLDDVHDVTFSDLQFLAAPAQATSESSIAAIIEDSKGIELERVALIASSGEDGANGATTPALAQAPDGNPPEPNAGAAPRSDCPCNSSGGRGGDRANTTTSNGGAGLPALGAGEGGNGGSKCQPGGEGASPEAGNPGFGASSLGTLDGASWQPANGEPGEPGGIGQGGGGGGGDTDGYGGGGACGGCGGLGGEPGGGGGASIGLLLLDSEVSLDACTITTGDGGNGGAGQVGQAGQPGGDGGPSTNACDGGKGGDGASGGPGGGGAGGISVGIVYRGEEPQVSDSSNFELGAAGEGGDGGGSDNHGLPGESTETLEISL